MNVEEISLRIKSNLRLKLGLSVVLTIGTWGLYLFLQRHPLFTVKFVSPTWIDRGLPFLPSTVYLYESIWLLMPIAPWLMKSKKDLWNYTKGMALVAAVCFLVFFFYPTSCLRPKDIQTGNFLYGVLIQIDSELNAWPSLHAAFAVFHGACCQAVFSESRADRRIQWMIWIWVSGIIVSTLLTKQHVIFDSAAGALLGLAGYALCCRSTKTQPENKI